MKHKAAAVGRWLSKVLGAAAPFVPDPKAKLAVGAAAAVLGAATNETNETDEEGTDAIVEKGDSA
jgi:hypothetical protein